MYKIGVNPLSWTNDDMPDLGGDTPLEVCLSEGKAAGYAGFELGHKFPRDASTLREVLNAHDLVLVSGWYSGNLIDRRIDEEIDAIQEHLALLKAMECHVLIYCDVTRAVHGAFGTPLSKRPIVRGKAWRDLCAKFSELGEYLRGEGIQLAYHHHMGTVVQTPSDVDALLDLTADEVGLLLDTGHWTFAGGDAVEAANLYAERIVHVHCKDVRRDILNRAIGSDSDFLQSVCDGVFTVPGDGTIDFPGVISALADVQYDGWWVVEAEQDPAKANPFDYVSQAYRYLTAELDKFDPAPAVR